MKRTKKFDRIVLDRTVKKAINGLYSAVGVPSTLTLKAVIKELQNQLKQENTYRPAEPSWMKSDQYPSEEQKIIEEFVAQEAVKKLGK